jgi:putative membrane protein
MFLPDERELGTRYLLVLLILLYAVARIFQLYADRLPTLLVVAFHVLPPAVFAFVHGNKTYRLRGILVFMVLSLGSATLFESLSLRTGFPFGHYYFTGVMGPKVFQLPVLLALAYVGMGYLSWIVSLLILGYQDRPLQGRRIVLLPLIASFVMVAWDLSMDPVWTNLYRAWVWRDGGSYFGVPVSNFLGWYLTVYLFYQAFALDLRRRAVLPLPPEYWRLPVLFYGVSAAGNLLIAAEPAMPAVVTDPSGRQWMASDIIGACVLVSTFVMGAFTLIAWARLSHPSRDSV